MPPIIKGDITLQDITYFHIRDGFFGDVFLGNSRITGVCDHIAASIFKDLLVPRQGFRLRL